MRVVITGANGLIGRGITAILMQAGKLDGRTISELVLSDRTAPAAPAGAPFEIRSVACDVRCASEVAALLNEPAAFVFHLAAIMSGAAERDYAEGWKINVDGTRHVLDACREQNSAPRLIFTSTIALYGDDVPDPVPDNCAIYPRNAYGAQKAMMELMIAEFSRRGYVDGRMVRISHIAIRHDDTHQGAGGFITAIVRQPLMGQEAICPVPPDMRVPMITPNTVFRSLIYLAELPVEAFADKRAIQLPATTVTVEQIIQAVRRAGGDQAAALIRIKPDAEFQKLLKGMPPAFVAGRARSLGFPITPDLDGTIAEFLEKQPVLFTNGKATACGAVLHAS